MNANWNDFNDADSQNDFDLIPKGTIAPVRMTIKPGGYDDPNQGWTGGYATRNVDTGSIYLSCEFVITQGPHVRRKVWSLVGLHSPKGPEWANMGRSFVRGILNSSRGISEKDSSHQAMQARRINGFQDLDRIEFLAKIDVEKNQHGDDKNVIKYAITPDSKEYGNQVSGGAGGAAPVASPPPGTAHPPGNGAPVAVAPQQAPSQAQAPANAGYQPPQQAPANAGHQAPQQATPPVEAQGQTPPTFQRPNWAVQ